MDKALENDIKIFMASRIAEGISLSDIQNEVNEKFQLSMTYMDIRILAAGLDIDWQAKAAAKAEEEKKEEENAPEEAAPEEPAAETDGKTVVEISKLMRPGTALSGSVKFASGSTADWYINQTGRLGLENLVGDQPTQDDIQQFQVELEKAVYGGR
ncbi:MAG: hypothetical protein IKC05_00490 [Lentisphaeria bacterium]|nr:hypothetical protein [Lentisphaeria bacterium]